MPIRRSCIPRRAEGLYGGLSRGCKQASRISARSRSRPCRPASAVARSPVPATLARLPGVEGELQVVHPTELVVHLEQRLDDRPDLGRQAVDLLVGDALELPLKLLVEVEEPPEAAQGGEPSIDLLV